MKKSIKTIITIFAVLHIAANLFGNEPENKSSLRSNKMNTTKQGLYGAAGIFTSFDNESIVGGGMKFDLFYRFALVNKKGPLFQSTKVDVGIEEFLTPAFNRVSAFVKLEPIAFFDVKIKLGHDYIFDFLPMDNANSDYSCQTRDDISKKTLSPKNGFRSDVIPTLKFAFGQIAVLYTFTWTYHYYNHKGYYYDYNTYILHKGSDSFFRHDVKFLFKVWDFRIGPQFVYSHVYSSEKNYMETNLLLAYFPTWKILKDTIKPFLGVSFGCFQKERYREGKFKHSYAFGISFKMY